MLHRLFVACVIAGCGSRAAAPVRWQAPVEIAQGGGTKGPWQQNESNFDYVDDGSVALADDGSAAVVWVDHRDKDVHFQRIGVARSINISRTPDVFSWLPRITIAGDDVLVVWQEIIFSGGSHGGDILFARSRDGGVTWSDPINLSRSIGGDGKGRIDAKTWHNGSFDLARAPNGTIHVAWTEYDGPLWITSGDGDSFAAPRQIAGTRDAPARAPSLAAANDAVWLAWTYGEDTAADIHVARIAPPVLIAGEAPSGRAGDQPVTQPPTGDSPIGARTSNDTPIVVAKTPTYSDAPKLVLADGVLHLAYAETSGGPFDPARIMYTRMREGAFEPPRPIGEGTFPSLAIDGDHVVAIWEDDVAERARGLAYAISDDRGATFTKPAHVEGSRDPAGGLNGSHQGRLMRKLAIKNGAIAIASSALAHGKASRVWLIRGHLQTSR